MATAPEGADALRYDIKLTSAHMAETAGELRERIAERKQAVASRLDLAEFAREHPWVALGIALGAGALLAGSGADEKAARATADAARKTPGAAKGLAKRAPGAAKGAALGLFGRLRGRRGAADVHLAETEQREREHRLGMARRLREQADAFVVDLRTESERMAGGIAPGTAMGTFGSASPFADRKAGDGGHASKPDGHDAAFGAVPGSAKLPERG